MKMIYDKTTGTLLYAAHVLIGDIDPMEQVTEQEQITEILAQDRPLHEFENEKGAETQKARSYLHCWALTPEETQALREMLEKKVNKTMDEELFGEEVIDRLTIPEGASPRNSEHYETLVVDIETYTKHALKLQTAIVAAEDALDDACRQQREAKAALDNARAKLQEHLDLIRNTHVTLRGGSS